MRLTRLELHGFKGREVSFDLSGRDVILGRNQSGKTAVVEALRFLATGRVPGANKGDLIAWTSPDDRGDRSFRVVGVFRANGEDSEERRAERTFLFRDERTSTTLDLRPRTKGNLKAKEAALAGWFEDEPFAFFDVGAFVGGTDAGRLDTLLALAPDADGSVVDAVRDETRGLDIEDVKWGLIEDRVEALILANGELKNTEGGLAGRLGIYADDAKERGNVARRELARIDETVRALGELSRNDFDAAAGNIATLEEDRGIAQSRLEGLVSEQATANERGARVVALVARRKTIIEEEIPGIEKHRETDATRLSEAKATVTEAEASLETTKATVATAEEDRAREKATLLADIEGVRTTATQDIDAIRRTLETNRKIHAEETERTNAAREHTLKVMAVSRNRIELLVSESRTDVPGEDGPTCPTCLRAFDGQGGLEAILASERMGFEQAEADYALHAEALKSIEERAKLLIVWPEQKIRDIERTRDSAVAERNRRILSLEDVVSKARIARATVEIALGQDRRDLEAAERGIEAGESKVEAKREALLGIDREIAETTTGAGTGLEDKIIDGVRGNLATLDTNLEDARAIQTRFKDQETLRLRRQGFDVDALAFSAIAKALGPLGAQGALLANCVEAIIGPAIRLVADALPGNFLAISMFDERGKPGLRIGLLATGEEGAHMRPWKAMSGAERGIVAAGLGIALVSDRAPLILAVECESMDGETQDRFLDALAGMAGPTAVLGTSHHPHGLDGDGPWVSHTISAPATRRRAPE